MLIVAPNRDKLRSRSLTLWLAAIAVTAVGCGTGDQTPDAAKGGNAQAMTSPANLSDLCAKLDHVYDVDMKATVEKIAPVEKEIVGKLMAGNTNVKDIIVKNHELFQSGIDRAMTTQEDLSTNTSANVAPTDHDAYVALYVGIGQKLTARSDEYKAILALEKKIDKDAIQTVLNDSRNVTAMDLQYNEAQR